MEINKLIEVRESRYKEWASYIRMENNTSVSFAKQKKKSLESIKRLDKIIKKKQQ